MCWRLISKSHLQAAYTFPVGVTTLWWYAPPTSSADADTSSENATDVPLDRKPVQPFDGASPPQFTASVAWSKPDATASSAPTIVDQAQGAQGVFQIRR